MTTRQPARALDSLLYEVLQATTMLLFVLSRISTYDEKHFVEPGVTQPLMLPGLPGLCISSCINQVADDELYGAEGAATRMAFKGWIAEVFGLWENRYRNELKELLGPDAIRPEMEAFGDLRHIRNDLLHSGKASADECGKCTVLKWFAPGETIVIAVRHVLDFLNQIGVLTLGGGAHDDKGRACQLLTFHDPDTLVNWRPKPKIVSVRMMVEGRDEDPPFKGVTVVFDNGLFANVTFAVSDKHQWETLGEPDIDSDGNLVFADGQTSGSVGLFWRTVDRLRRRNNGEDIPRVPVTGPGLRFRRREDDKIGGA